MRTTRLRTRRAAATLAVGAAAAAVGLILVPGDGSDSSANAFDASDLPMRQLAGQRLVAGFGGREPPPALRQMIHRGELAGVVLFSDNFRNRAEARRLSRRLQGIRRPRGLRAPLLVMIDQEGGEIRRLPGPPRPSAAEMGRHDAAFNRRQGRLTARNLAAAGVNVDLAPVLDVGRPGGVIDEDGRSFGASAARVSETAVAFAEGLQAGDVAATAKHFPGLGAADVNTDLGVERIELPQATLRGVDERPFGAFAGAGGRLVMISTAIYPAFSERPAVFARSLATDELRDQAGFGGVSISDDLQSAAARAFGSPAMVGRSAARAGTDLLLYRHYGAGAQAGAALREALRAGRLPRGEFERSAQRVLDLRAALAAGSARR